MCFCSPNSRLLNRLHDGVSDSRIFYTDLRGNFISEAYMSRSIDAMILAAGHGTRLRPLTDSIPKALVEVGNVPMLERVARQLIAAGATRLIVNTHYLGDKVRAFIESDPIPGVEWLLSEEKEEVLDTGGGLLGAQSLFAGDRPFFLHNVDILCDTDLQEMYKAACATGAIATLAVMERESSRYLLFDENGLLGHGNEMKGTERRVREPVGNAERLGFCGIHVIAPRIFETIIENGVFSIITLYMRLAAEGENIRPWRIDQARWMDIGTPEKLAEANREWRNVGEVG